MRVHDHPGRPFAAALDSAIAARGLTLDQVRRHLADHGVAVSTATLSYWRRDLRQPENERSHHAIALLERFLDLPRTTLTGLLGKPRPRGRRATRPEPPHIAALLAKLAYPGEGRRTLISAHDVFTVSPDGTERGVRSRIVIHGLAGPVTRHVIRYQSDHRPHRPTLTAVSYATPGRVLTDPDTGLMVAELVLDRPIRAGDHAVLEYEVAAHPSHPVSYYSRTLHNALSEYTQLIHFEGRPPTSCTSYWRATPTAPTRLRQPVPMGASRTSCLVVRDGCRGIVGTNWTW